MTDNKSFSELRKELEARPGGKEAIERARVDLDREVAGAQVVRFPRRPGQEVALTYKQLGMELGLSKSQLHVLRREGMPSEGLDYAGRRVFLLSRVKPWLDRRQKRLGRSD